MFGKYISSHLFEILLPIDVGFMYIHVIGAVQIRFRN
jgi:hypothetical protein